MRRAAVLFAVLAALSLTSSARAVTLVNPDGTPSPAYQRIAAAAAVPTARATLTIDLGPRPCTEADACTGGSIIWMDPQSPVIRFALLHELGHQFDARLMTEADRSAYERLAGFGTRPWDGCEYVPAAGCSPYQFSPDEAFANAYASCARDASAAIWARGSGMPIRKVAICGLIRWVGEHSPGAADWSKAARSARARAR